MKNLNPHYGLTNELRRRVLSMAAVVPIRDVAAHFRLHTSTIYRWRRQMNITPNSVVSSGTLRTEDLVRNFLSALGPFASEGLKSDAERWLRKGFPDYIQDGAGEEILNELAEELMLLAPPGCFFGSHPGDGALFGFWEEE